MADTTWLVLREQGAIVEEADEDDDVEDIFNEKDALAEKLGLHLEDIAARIDVADVETGDGGVGG